MKKFRFNRFGTLTRFKAVGINVGTGKISLDYEYCWWWPLNWFWFIVLTPFAIWLVLKDRRHTARMLEEARQAGERG